jgi:AcrR family transcriptional regulator
MSEAKKRRGDETRELLMRAAEHLVSVQGIENVTVRAIIQEAGQKNESALQYHFKNRDGLLSAIHEDRNAQVKELRGEMAKELLAGEQLKLRELCRLMVMPSFELARKDEGFRQYVSGFGPGIAHSSRPADRVFDHARADAAAALLEQLRGHLSHLTDALFRMRLDSTVKFVALTMSDQAAIPRGLAGKQGELFVSNLIDTMVGMLSAVVSTETREFI